MVFLEDCSHRDTRTNFVEFIYQASKRIVSYQILITSLICHPSRYLSILVFSLVPSWIIYSLDKSHPGQLLQHSCRVFLGVWEVYGERERAESQSGDWYPEDQTKEGRPVPQAYSGGVQWSLLPDFFWDLDSWRCPKRADTRRNPWASCHHLLEGTRVSLPIRQDGVLQTLVPDHKWHEPHAKWEVCVFSSRYFLTNSRY